MRYLGAGLKSVLGLTVVLVCSCAFSESSPATSKSTSTHTGSKVKSPTSGAAAQSKSARIGSSRTLSRSTGSRKGKRSKKVRGQQKIDSERTHQIQEALIRQHYMTGMATGKWDASTEDALRHFQADNGWQNKTVPDSRALIKLGLGPNHDHLLNPESAMTTSADAPRSSTTPASVPPSTSTANQPQR
jgi:Putative peptidoglycan binding domain